MKLAICGLKFSQNLGDELIVDSLKHLIITHIQAVEFIDVDIFGREKKARESMPMTRPPILVPVRELVEV